MIKGNKYAYQSIDHVNHHLRVSAIIFLARLLNVSGSSTDLQLATFSGCPKRQPQCVD
jgi:hypothetical protein